MFPKSRVKQVSQRVPFNLPTVQVAVQAVCLANFLVQVGDNCSPFFSLYLFLSLFLPLCAPLCNMFAVLCLWAVCGVKCTYCDTYRRGIWHGWRDLQWMQDATARERGVRGSGRRKKTSCARCNALWSQQGHSMPLEATPRSLPN